MFPVYGYMDPYTQIHPHQGQQNYYPCQSYPQWASMPSQVKADTVKQPFVVVPPSFCSNFPHPTPSDHTGCCRHNCFPCHYSFRPPFPSPQPFLYQPYPPYPNAYPPYSIPPTHYSIDQARYDYDKTRNHCCGCPNHTVGQRDDSSPEIEELKPEQDKTSPSLIQLPNYSNPVVWFPQRSLKEEDDKASESQPGQSTGWIPLDMNSLKKLKQDSEGKKEQRVGDKTADQHAPFPIIWVPGYDKLKGGTKDVKEITPKSVKDWPSMFKIVPLDHAEIEDWAEKPGVTEDVPKDKLQPEATREKESKIKTIPVKKISALEKPEEKVQEKKYTISDKQNEDNEGKKVSEQKPSSPVRSSKLPPVCLRVDPLPRKKVANGKSRSPSPPGRKDGKNEQHNENQSPRMETREHISEKDIPVMKVNDKSSIQVEKERQGQENMLTALLNSTKENLRSDLKDMEVAEASKDGEKKNSEESKIAVKESTEAEVKRGCTGSSQSKHAEEKEGRIREFSLEDAAVAIQSAYRGYEVRRWQPVEKLRKIAKIREKVGSIRDQILSVEASSDGWDAKQRVVISETIMNLLLQLDTIQGLHPSVREIRKSVAKELICLQEKLDSVGAQHMQEHKATKAKEATTTDGEAASGSSSSVTAPSVEHEPSKERIDITEPETLHQLGQVEEEAVTDEVATPTGSPLETEQVNEHEPLQQKVECEDVATVDQPAQAKEGALADEVEATVCSPFVTEEQVYDESLQHVEGENNAEDKPLAENVEFEIVCEQDVDLSPATETSPASLSIPEPIPEKVFSQLPEANSEQEQFGDEIEGEAEVIGSTSVTAEVSGEPQEPANLTVNDEDCKVYVKEVVEPHLQDNNRENEARDQVAPSFIAADDAQANEILELLQQNMEVQSTPKEVVPKQPEELHLASDEKESIVHYASEDKSEMVVVPIEEQRQDQYTAQQETPQMLSSVIDIKVRNAGGVSENLKETTAGNEIFCVGVGELAGKNAVVDEVEGLEDLKETPPPGNEICSIGVGELANENERDVHPCAETETTDGVGELANKNERDVHPCAEAETTDGVAPDEGVPHALAPEMESTGLDERSITNVKVELKDDEGKKLLEENQKLREMLEKLLDAGKEQLGTITNLNGRVKDLERKLAQKKRVKVRRNKVVKSRSCEVSCR